MINLRNTYHFIRRPEDYLKILTLYYCLSSGDRRRGESLAFLMFCVRILHVVFLHVWQKRDFSKGLPLHPLPLPMPQVFLLGFCFVANFVFRDNVLGKDASKPRHHMQNVWWERKSRPVLWRDRAPQCSRTSRSVPEFIWPGLLSPLAWWCLMRSAGCFVYMNNT